MLRVGLSLFLTGLFLGAGPCLVSCGPFLVSFIAGNKQNFKQSLWIWFVFSLSRILAYLILGVTAGFLSQEVVSRIYETVLAKFIFIAGGVLLVVIGILMVINKSSKFGACEILKEKLIKNNTKSIFMFGLIIGLLPCPPLVGVLTYIVLISKSVLKGVFYCFSFGLGTLISPLIIMAICASYIAKLLGSQERIYIIFQKICAIIISLLGIQLLLKGIYL